MTTGPGSGPPPDGDDATFADVLNGFTLDSGRGRRKRKKKDPEADADAPAQPEQPPQPAPPQPGDAVPGYPEPGQGSGYFDSAPGPGYYESASRSGYYDAPQAAPGYPEHEPDSGYYPPSEDSGHFDQRSGYFDPAGGTSFGSGFFEPAVSNSGPALPSRPEPAPPEEETAAVRPYALTGGRTRASYALELETLVSAKESVAAHLDQGPAMQFEHRQIVEECRAPRSVAEIAALLRVPVGVARVLISDAADAGLITVHKTVSGSDNAEAHFMLMERVLSGLRRL